MRAKGYRLFGFIRIFVSMDRGEIIIYQTADGETRLDVRMENDSVWLTQAQIAHLFGVDRTVIVRHVNNIYKSSELERDVTCAKIAHVGNDDKQIYNTKYYNLDMIISIGFRVNSKKAIKFRTWANKIIKEYMIKGFTMDDERLKGNGGGNYWKELLARIKDIRSSEKVMYRQVLDLYSTAIDYDPKDEKTIEFIKIVQNKLHNATH